MMDQLLVLPCSPVVQFEMCDQEGGVVVGCMRFEAWDQERVVVVGCIRFFAISFPAAADLAVALFLLPCAASE